MSKRQMNLQINNNAIHLFEDGISQFSQPFENAEGCEAWLLAGKWLVANNAYIPEDQMAGLMPQIKRCLRGKMPYKYEITVREHSTKLYTVESYRQMTLEEEENVESEGIDALPKGFSVEFDSEEGEYPNAVDIMDISDELDES